MGAVRCYVKVGRDAPVTYGDLIDGILNRSTFTTSGPLLFLRVNGVDIGGEVEVDAGAPLAISAEVRSPARPSKRYAGGGSHRWR